LGQTQKCGGVEPVHGIATQTVFCILYTYFVDISIAFKLPAVFRLILIYLMSVTVMMMFSLSFVFYDILKVKAMPKLFSFAD